MNCKNCGNEIEKNERFCGNCGTEIIWEDTIEQHNTQETMRVCPNCNAELSLDDEFCGKCGQKVNLEKNDTNRVQNIVFEGTETGGQERNELSKPANKLVIRKFWKYLLLGTLTCGIYAFYVLWHITKDINTICEGDGKRSPNYLIVLLLSTVTLGIYAYYWYYTQGKRLYEAAPIYNVDNDKNGMFYLIWMLFLPSIGGLISIYFIFKNLNRCAEAYNNGIINYDNRRIQKATTTQKVLFGVAVFLRCAIIIGAVALIGVTSTMEADEEIYDESEIVSDEIQVYEFEADELGAILNTDEEEQYYEETLYVHGWLYRHPAEEGIYSLYNATADGVAGESDAVIFTCDSLSEDIGDGSEIIVTGTLGSIGETTSLTVLLGTDVEIIEQVEPVYSVGTVEELFENSSEYIGKKVCIVGPVEGVGDSIWIMDYSNADIWIRLTGEIMNIPYDAVEDWSAATVTGIFKLDDYGEAVIEVESVE